MQTDVRATAKRPEALFAEIAEPRLAYVIQSLNSNPLRASLLFALVMMVFTTMLTLGQVQATDNGALVDLLPSETVFALLLGVAVFPLRLILVPVLTYATCFAMAFGLRLWLEPGYLPTGAAPLPFLLAAMALNALPATAAALAGRAIAARSRQKGARGDVLLTLGTTVAYVPLAAVTVWLVLAVLLPAGWPKGSFGDLSALGAGLIRAARIGLCGAVLMLYLLDRPTRRNLTVAVAVLPTFLILALLRLAGYAGYPPVDVELLALAVALLAPAYAAILANIFGVVAYVVLTGEFLVQIPVTSPEVLRLELVSVLLLALIYLVLLQRHLASAERRMNRATINRMMRVRELATLGYFVLDARSGEVRVDGVAADVLHTGDRFAIADFLQRVRPDDRQAIQDALAERSGASRTLHFLLSPEDRWTRPDEARYLAVHAWYEGRPGGGLLAYGALIDLTDDHRREEALAEALATLSEQQNRQTQMFSIVSHELRTPASVIAMLLEELENGASWQEMGPRLRAVSDQLLSVLADMRQTVRPEENLPVRMETIQPKDLAETVRNTFALMAGTRQIDLDLDLAPEAWQARVSDRVRLMQALSNLVKNAILHAECRRISIGYSEEMAETGIIGTWRVADDGRGVPEESRATLFDAFHRGAGPTTSKADGSGLGLFVTKSSIELLGGTVLHQPRAAGGSVFLLRVPMALPEGRIEVADAPRNDLADYRTKTVLIAEDSELIGELLVARLRRIFGKVLWVKDGASALATYEREKPDVILTDLFMPEMGGDDLTAALRGLGARCPVIGMTAAAIGDERERFEQAGTDRVLTKPVSTAQLLEVLEAVGPRGTTEPSAVE